MIWSKKLPGGLELYIDHALSAYGSYRPSREYIVLARANGGSPKGICKVDARGEPIKWYDQGVNGPPGNRTDWLEAMKDLPDALAIEQVMET